MNSRVLAYEFLRAYQQKSAFLIRSTRTSSSNLQVVTKSSRWTLKRYTILIGAPVLTAACYRLTTKAETRRKHRLIVGSVFRATR